MNRRSDFYDEFEASELFCSTCQRATPVTNRLLIVLPAGNKFDYLCSVCGNSVGSKMDDDRTACDRLKPS